MDADNRGHNTFRHPAVPSSHRVVSGSSQEGESYQDLRLASRFYEVVGGPLDGMECFRNLRGLFYFDKVIMFTDGGYLLCGNMVMPRFLRYLVGGMVRYYYLYRVGGKDKYVYEGLL